MNEKNVYDNGGLMYSCIHVCISRYIDVIEKNVYDNCGLMYSCIHVCISRYFDVNEKNVYVMAGIDVTMYVYLYILL